MAVLEAEFESKTLQRVAVTLLLCMLCATAFADTLVTNGGVTLDTSDLPYCTADETAPVVYFISDISPESLVEAYQALGVALPGKVGVKMSTGESERSNYLRPELIPDWIKAKAYSFLDEPLKDVLRRWKKFVPHQFPG